MSLPWSARCQQTPGDKAAGEGNSKLRLPEGTDPTPNAQQTGSHPSPPSWQLLEPRTDSSARPQTTKTTTYQYQHHDLSQEMKGKQGWSPPHCQDRLCTAANSWLCTSAQTSPLGAKCSLRWIWQMSSLEGVKGRLESNKASLSVQVESIDFSILNQSISTLQIKIMYQLQKQKKTTMQNWGQKFVPNTAAPNQRFHNLCT